MIISNTQRSLVQKYLSKSSFPQLGLQAFKRQLETLGGSALKKSVDEEPSSIGDYTSLASTSSVAQKTASKNGKMSWIPQEGSMRAKTAGGANFWVEWKRVASTSLGWKIKGFVYIYAKGKPQPASKMAFDANRSFVQRDGQLFVTLPHSQTQIWGTQKINETASGKIYFDFHSIYARILANKSLKNRLFVKNKRVNVTMASADLLLFLQKHQKAVEGKTTLGAWLRSNLAKLMKATDLGELVPKSVRLAVEASGLDMKLFGLKPTPIRGRKLTANIHDVLRDINMMDMELDRVLLQRMRNAFGPGRMGITTAELQRIQLDLRRDLLNGNRTEHPYYNILRMLQDLLVRPGVLDNNGIGWVAARDLQQTLWEMVQAATDNMNINAYRDEMQQLIEGEIGRGERADAIVNAIFDLNIFRPNGVANALAANVAGFLNDNRDRINPGFNDARVGAAFYLTGWQGGSF